MKLLSRLFAKSTVLSLIFLRIYSSQSRYVVFKDSETNNFLTVRATQKYFNLTFLELDKNSEVIIYKIQMMAKNPENYQVGCLLSGKGSVVSQLDGTEEKDLLFKNTALDSQNERNYEQIDLPEDHASKGSLPKAMIDTLGLNEKEERLVYGISFTTDFLTQKPAVRKNQLDQLHSKESWYFVEVEKDSVGNLLLCCVFIQLLPDQDEFLFPQNQVVLYCFLHFQTSSEQNEPARVARDGSYLFYRINYKPEPEENAAQFFIDLGLEKKFLISLHSNEDELSCDLSSYCYDSEEFIRETSLEVDDKLIGEVLAVLTNKLEVLSS